MDTQALDQQFAQLQNQSQQTVQALQALGGKLQAAAQSGDQQAREWFLDLRELAISFKAEQDQMTSLLQAIHGFVASEAQNQGYGQGGYGGIQNGGGQNPGSQNGGNWAQAPGYGQAPYAGGGGGFVPAPQQGGFAPQPQPQGQQGVGGMLGSFLNSGFGRAIETGAGFGIGDDLINKIF